MVAKVICLASAKGGSGKTVLSATFGTFLVAMGKRVLLIDTDAATNGLSLLYLKEVTNWRGVSSDVSQTRKGIYEASPNELPDIVELDNGVHLIPATYQFQNTEGASLESYRESLRGTLNLLRDRYNYIFLDAQAGSDVFAQTAMSRDISDEVVIVSEYDPISAAGVERLKSILSADLTYDRTWILLNKMLPEFVKKFSEFLSVARYVSPVPWGAEVVRAFARRRLALNTEEGSAHTLAIMQTVSSLLGDEIEADLSHWKSIKEDYIRQPVVEQVKDVESELEGAVKTRIKNEKSIRDLKRQPVLLKIRAIVAAFVALIVVTMSLVIFGIGTFGTPWSRFSIGGSVALGIGMGFFFLLGGRRSS